MSNPQAFLSTIKSHDAKSIPAATLRKVRAIMEEPFFNYATMSAKSLAAANLVTWVINTVEFNSLYNKVASLQSAVETTPVVDHPAHTPLMVETVSAEEAASLVDAANDS